jgi:hypothetical protein
VFRKYPFPKSSSLVAWDGNIGSGFASVVEVGWPCSSGESTLRGIEVSALDKILFRNGLEVNILESSTLFKIDVKSSSPPNPSASRLERLLLSLRHNT